jgi:hypothetical protein
MTYGFKEWALVCEALGSGAQSVILRKGGIAEGRAGFRFAHEDFLLFPTLFHEQVQRLTLPENTPVPTARPDAQWEITLRARVEWTREVTDWETARALAPFHSWREELLAERFNYSEKTGINLAWVRIERLSEPFVFPDSRAYGGCRSWITLPELPTHITSTPVLDEETHRAREQALLTALGLSPADREVPV